jgi:AcrR family transcriptional regulator
MASVAAFIMISFNCGTVMKHKFHDGVKRGRTDVAKNSHPQRPEPLADVRASATERGRINQKLRTRLALVEAATELVTAGASPTLAEVAERALVSKATAYRYFASAEDLIAEVFFDRDFPTEAGVLESVDELDDRVLAVEGAVNDTLLMHEGAMRMIVRNALDRTIAATDEAPHRLGRRRGLIDAALEPFERELDADALGFLRDALALVIGPEAIIAARDVCGLSPERTREVTTWAAAALIARARSTSDEAGSMLR